MDNQTMLDLAKVLSAVVELQIKQTKATSILVAHSGVQAEVDRAQHLIGDSESQSLQSLRDKVHEIVARLSK